MPYGGGGGGSSGGSGSGGGAAGGTAGSQGGSKTYKMSFMGDRALAIGGYPAVDTISYFDINTGGAAVGALAASNLSFETSRSELPSNANLSVKMVTNSTTAKIIFTDSESTMLEATGDCINSNTTLQFSVFYQSG